MIFKLINEKVTDNVLELTIENLEVSADHWHSVKNILKIASALEEISRLDFTSNAFEIATMDFLLNLVKTNRRIKQIKCLRYNGSNNEFLILLESEIPTFKPENFFKRSINYYFKKQNKTFLILDLTSEEFKQLNNNDIINKHLSDWNFEDNITNKLNKYIQLFI